ncbi:hypothetical protein J3F83DRAFT_757224 [Trichoderma novae-zelandiae]
MYSLAFSSLVSFVYLAAYRWGTTPYTYRARTGISSPYLNLTVAVVHACFRMRFPIYRNQMRRRQRGRARATRRPTRDCLALVYTSFMRDAERQAAKGAITYRYVQCSVGST